MTPVVTGEVDLTVLDDLVRLCVQLDHYRRRHDRDGTGNSGGDGEGSAAEGTGTAADGSTRQGTPDSDTSRARDALEQAIIGKAVSLLSGPGGLASFLRRRQLGARLGGPSLPLDVGMSSDIPAAIRRAVILRDQHCRFPGGCDQPAAGCEVHHLRHKADGGKTSVTDCGLFCFLSGSRGALLRPRPPQNRTCRFPGIRLKQAPWVWRVAVPGSCAAAPEGRGSRRCVSRMWWPRGCRAAGRARWVRAGWSAG